MRPLLAIAGRELRAYFLSPGGYVVASLFLGANGLFFARYVFRQGEVASLRPVFAFSMVVFVLLCPAITMRMISEELRHGTIEMLMTSPVSAAEIILGKFAAAVGFLVLLVLPTGVFVLALELYGRPDYGELFCGYLGLILAGSVYLASGILASTLTSNQVIAYLVTVFCWILLLLTVKGLPGSEILPPASRESLSDLLVALDPDLRVRDFAIGLFDSANVVYFSTAVLFLLIASVTSLGMRRLR